MGLWRCREEGLGFIGGHGGDGGDGGDGGLARLGWGGDNKPTGRGVVWRCKRQKKAIY